MRPLTMRVIFASILFCLLPSNPALQAQIGDGSVRPRGEGPSTVSRLSECPEGMIALDFNDLESSETVAPDRYIDQGARIETGPGSTATDVVRASLSNGPCDGSRALQTEPFTGPSIRILFPEGVSEVTLQSGDFGPSDADDITLIAYSDEGMTPVTSDNQLLGQGVPTGCVDLAVAAPQIGAVDLFSEGPYPNSVFADNLCYRPAAGNICGRIGAAHGEGIDRIGWDTGACRLFFDDGSNAPVMTDLLESVMLRREASDFVFSGQDRQACAILNQAVQLCNDGVFDPTKGPTPTRISVAQQFSSCHPNAEWMCSPFEPDFEGILETANINHDASSMPVPNPSFCAGQVVGMGSGYASEVPVNPLQWECVGDDATRLQNVIKLAKDAGTPLMGYRYWPTDLASSPNQCRFVKALVDCVVPNLGAPRSCPVRREDGGGNGNGGNERACENGNRQQCGVAYGVDDYCYRIVLTTGGTETSTHFAGRAADFNNGNFLGQFNYGNISSCNEQKCADTFRVAQLNLPPAFVSTMEGCGFTWGGRWWRAEGVYTACDPMHFELCPLDAPINCRGLD